MSFRRWSSVGERKKHARDLSSYKLISKLSALATDALLQEQRRLIFNENEDSDDDDDDFSDDNPPLLDDLQDFQEILSTLELQQSIQVCLNARKIHGGFEDPTIVWS